MFGLLEPSLWLLSKGLSVEAHLEVLGEEREGVCKGLGETQGGRGGQWSSPGHLKGKAAGFADRRKRVVKMPPLFWPGRWEEELSSRKMARLWESGLVLSKVALSCAVNIL